MTHTIAIAGLDCYLDPHTHKIKQFTEAFMNNVRTYHADNKSTITAYTQLDVRSYRPIANPMAAIFSAIKRSVAKNGPIDVMFISCHSDHEGLYLVSKYKKGVIPDSYRYVEYDTSWEGVTFSPTGHMRLASCQTSGRFGKKWDTCIAQNIADKIGVSVFGFTGRSAQHQEGDRFFQVCDFNGYVECTPNVAR